MHVVELMHYAKDLFTTYGGHEFSGGFAISERGLFDLHIKLEEAYLKIKKDVGDQESYAIDCPLSLSLVNESFFRELSFLAPCGVGNPKPVFSFSDVVISSIRHFGSESEHLEIIVSNGTLSRKAIAFFKTSADFPKLTIGQSCTLIATVEKSYFLNRPELRLRIVDVK